MCSSDLAAVQRGEAPPIGLAAGHDEHMNMPSRKVKFGHLVSEACRMSSGRFTGLNISSVDDHLQGEDLLEHLCHHGFKQRSQGLCHVFFARLALN